MSKGFSLVELVVGIVFLSVIGVVTLSKFIPLDGKAAAVAVSKQSATGIPCDASNSSTACSR